MTQLLQADNIMNDGGISSWQEQVKAIKEKTAFVSLNYEKDLELAKNGNQHVMDYQMPDGSTVNVNTPRF